MKIFLKIGLPWAVSLSVVFYLGLSLGTSNLSKDYDPQSLPSSHIGLQNVRSKNNEQVAAKTEEVKSTLKPTQSGSKQTPLMPPNLQRIMQGGDIVERLGSYLDAVRSMDRSNVKEVVQAFEELPGGYGRHLEMKLLMRSWVNFDPEGALAYASTSLDAKSERRFGISEALAGWAVKDEKAAIGWANQNHPAGKNGDNPLLVGIVKGLMETDLDAANRLFLTLPKGSARWQSSSILAEKFSQRGVDQGIQWAESYPKDDPRMRETILGQMGARLAQQDLTATAVWAKSMNDEPGAYRVMENLIHQWANQDPQSAATWIDYLPNPKKKAHAMSELTGRWALVDPAATAEWLNSQPSSSENDPAIATFVSRIQGIDPEGAVGWASSISEPSLRERSMQQAIEAWKQTDPEKASQWLEQNEETTNP